MFMCSTVEESSTMVSEIAEPPNVNYSDDELNNILTAMDTPTLEKHISFWSDLSSISDQFLSPDSFSTGVCQKSGGETDEFPVGLRVLVVDDDSVWLSIAETMLRKCRYEVTKCDRTEIALSLLQENKNGFDIVISDVHTPDMDGFKLLEHVGLEMDLPVIMVSADNRKSVVMEGISHGACDYLIKPVSFEVLKNIWQHVLRRRKHDLNDFQQSKPSEGEDEHVESPSRLGVMSNSITYSELEKHFGKKLEDVAQSFGVSRSKFKHICRENKISRWPQTKRKKKVNGSPSRRDPPCSDLRAEKLKAIVTHTSIPVVTTPPEVETITIKATYGDDMIKFHLSFPLRREELEEKVSKKLKLNIGTYKIKYTDDEGDRILVLWDEDLQDCMRASNSLGMNTIKLFIEPIIRTSTCMNCQHFLLPSSPFAT